MGLSLSGVLRRGVLLAAFSCVLSAAPVLRLVTSTVGPVSIATGGAGAVQTVEAYNAGDGSLVLQLSSSVNWITPTIGSPRACSSRSGTCLPIQIALPTLTLAKGVHTGVVTVNDSNAIDAPQTITVTVQIGGGVPDRVDLYVPPTGASAEHRFYTNSPILGKETTESGGSWLSLSLEGGGTFQFPLPYRIAGRHLSGMSTGNYNGSVQISKSTLAADNKAVPVTLHVTSQPIAALSSESMKFRHLKKDVQYLTVVNTGQGTLSVTSVTPSTSSGGSWLSAELLGDTTYKVTADATGLAAGRYQGSLAVASNAANGTLTVPVELEAIVQGPPRASFGGAVNIATYDNTDPVSPGDIVAVFGEQFSTGDPTQGTQLPLVTQLGGATVYVNDRLSPLYFTSYGQINFQVPYETTTGRAVVRVDRDGAKGNSISVDVTDRAARILPRGIDRYGIVLVSEPVTTYAMPSAVAARYGLQGRPARKGEYLVMYVIGMGITSPVLASGAAAPSQEPLARITPNPEVNFGAFGPVNPGLNTNALFAGLTPTLVGLYQVNFQVPLNAPSGDAVTIRLELNKQPLSNQVTIAIE